MALTYQRSFRLRSDLKAKIESLPHGTSNTLVNALLEQFFADPKLRASLKLSDGRFKNWKPHKLVPMEPKTLPLPLPELKPVEAKKVTKLDDMLPGL